MKPTDLKAENSDETIGRSLRRRRWRAKTV